MVGIRQVTQKKERKMANHDFHQKHFGEIKKHAPAAPQPGPG